MAKPVSVEKLQSFIEAVIFAADLEDPDAWVPTPRQWKKIREMIDNLEAASPVSHQPVQYAPMGMPQAEPQYSHPPRMAGPSAMDAPMYRPTAQLPSDVPMATGSSLAVRTPDIDTLNGNYASSFA